MAAQNSNNFNAPAAPFMNSTPDAALDTWLPATQGRGMTLVTAGQSGAGKSTLVKNLLRLGEDDAQKPQILHSPTSVTETVQIYNETVDRVPVRIVDMPGLVAPDQNEKKIIAQLKKETNGEADMLLYCVSMAPCSKLGYIDRDIVQLLTSTFSKQIWERTILVLTFADLAKRELDDSNSTRAPGEEEITLKDIVQRYTNEFENILESTQVKSRSSPFSVHCFDPEEMMNERGSLQIAAIPTSKKRREELFDRCNWDDCIFLEVLRKCNRKAIPAFLKISRSDFAVHVGGVLAAGGVGAGIGGALGVGIGASVGAIGFGVGAIPGAFLGGAIGVIASTGAAIVAKRFKE